MHWLARFWSPPPARPVAERPASVVEPRPAAVAVGARPFLPWLPDNAPLTHGAISADEQGALAELEKILLLPAIPDILLPRAAELIPQLMALLRETQLPLQAIAERVSKDAVLAAEVMRLASSAYYRTQSEVADMPQAIQRIGLAGLQQVIARVVLKPIYRGSAGALSASVAARLWEQSEALAQQTATLAEPAGLPVFDAYLVGMLYNTGWKVALHGMERARVTLDPQPSSRFVSALVEQVHRLFGHAAQRWAITPGFTAFAHDARNHGLAGSTHPMTALLQQAQQRCLPETRPADDTRLPG